MTGKMLAVGAAMAFAIAPVRAQSTTTAALPARAIRGDSRSPT